MSDGPTPDDITLCLLQMKAGDEMARDRLYGHIYADMKKVAQRLFATQKADQTLQPTALVHEAYLRLAGGDQQSYADRRHFLSVAAIAMRQLITDQARARNAQKRLGAKQRRTLDHADGLQTPETGVDFAALDEALGELADLDARQYRIVELRFLAGFTVDETAEILGISPRTVALDWKMARSFLSLRLGDFDPS